MGHKHISAGTIRSPSGSGARVNGGASRDQLVADSLLERGTMKTIELPYYLANPTGSVKMDCTLVEIVFRFHASTAAWCGEWITRLYFPRLIMAQSSQDVNEVLLFEQGKRNLLSVCASVREAISYLALKHEMCSPEEFIELCLQREQISQQDAAMLGQALAEETNCASTRRFASRAAL